MMRYALTAEGPVAIRYAKEDRSGLEDAPDIKQVYSPRWQRLRAGADAALLACGAMAKEAMLAAAMLTENGMECAVFGCGCVQPLDKEALSQLMKAQIPLVTLEEGVLTGGFGSCVAQYCAAHGSRQPLLNLGIEGLCTTQGAHDRQLKAQRLDAQSIAERLMAWKDEGNR